MLSERSRADGLMGDVDMHPAAPEKKQEQRREVDGTQRGGALQVGRERKRFQVDGIPAQSLGGEKVCILLEFTIHQALLEASGMTRDE